MKISSPNYTQIPNDMLDQWLPLLGEAEVKVLLVIMRKTFGWHKTHDEISISQLAKTTGMLRETVINAAKSLQDKGVITRQVIGEKGTQRTIYSLVVEEESNKSYQSVKPTGPVGLDLLGSTDSQKKHSLSKETAAKERKPAAVFSSEKVQEKTKPKVYPILEGFDIAEATKVKYTRECDEKTCVNARAWATHPRNPPKRSLTASFIYACQNGLSCEEFDHQALTPYEMVSKCFEDDGIYNGARCTLKKEAIAFTRTMKYGEVKFDKFFTTQKLIDLCNSFGIPFKPHEKK